MKTFSINWVCLVNSKMNAKKLNISGRFGLGPVSVVDVRELFTDNDDKKRNIWSCFFWREKNWKGFKSLVSDFLEKGKPRRKNHWANCLVRGKSFIEPGAYVSSLNLLSTASILHIMPEPSMFNYLINIQWTGCPIIVSSRLLQLS